MEGDPAKLRVQYAEKVLEQAPTVLWDPGARESPPPLKWGGITNLAFSGGSWFGPTIFLFKARFHVKQGGREVWETPLYQFPTALR